MKAQKKTKLVSKVSRVVKRTQNGKPSGGYVEVLVKYGNQWRRLFFAIEESPR